MEPISSAFVPAATGGSVNASFVVVLLLVEAFVTGLLAWRTWEARDTYDTAGALAAVLAVISAKAVVYAFRVGVSGVALTVAGLKASYVLLLLIPLPWFVFAVQFTDRDALLTRPVLAAIVLPAAVMTPLIWLNPGGVVFAGFDPIRGFQQFVPVFGPLYWAGVLYGYVVVALGVAAVVDTHLSNRVRRWPTLVLLSGVFVPWLGHVTDHLDVLPEQVGNVTVFALGFTGIAWYLAVFRLNVLDLLPVARRELVDTMADGVLVVSQSGRIADANPAVGELLGVQPNALVGRDAHDALAPYVDDPETYLSDEVTAGEEQIETGNTERTVDIRSQHLRDGDALGYLLLFRDITPIKRYQWRLERQNERLDRFASVVSHDLRNPLSIAEGHLELAEERGGDGHLEQVGDALDRMENIIDDALTIAREGETVEETREVSVRTVAERAWENTRTGSATLEFAFETADPTVEADPDRLSRVFENLFRNSIEHSSTDSQRSGESAPEHGGADVTVRVGGTQTEFFVEDDGPGLEDVNEERLFEYGYSYGEGTGFGLAIVRSIVDAHGWTVRATESSMGGARFEVSTASADHPSGAVDEATVQA